MACPPRASWAWCHVSSRGALPESFTHHPSALWKPSSWVKEQPCGLLDCWNPAFLWLFSVSLRGWGWDYGLFFFFSCKSKSRPHPSPPLRKPLSLDDATLSLLVAGVSSDLLPSCFLFKWLHSLPVLFLPGKLPISPFTPSSSVASWFSSDPCHDTRLCLTTTSTPLICHSTISRLPAGFFFTFLKKNFFWTIWHTTNCTCLIYIIW